LKLSLPHYIVSQTWERGINFLENFSSFVELENNSALEDRVYLHGVIFKKGKYFTALSAQKIGLAIGSVVRLRQDNRILNVVLITTIFNAPEIWLCKDTTCLEVEIYSVHEIQDVIDVSFATKRPRKLVPCVEEDEFTDIILNLQDALKNQKTKVKFISDLANRERKTRKETNATNIPVTVANDNNKTSPVTTTSVQSTTSTTSTEGCNVNDIKQATKKQSQAKKSTRKQAEMLQEVTDYAGATQLKRKTIPVVPFDPSSTRPGNHIIKQVQQQPSISTGKTLAPQLKTIKNATLNVAYQIQPVTLRTIRTTKAINQTNELVQIPEVRRPL